MNLLIKKPSAWIPIALTLLMVGMMVLYFAHIIPPEPAGDEGIMAHFFQLWVLLEFFTILFFALKWFPKDFRNAWKIAAIQIMLAAIPLVVVWFLES